MHVLEGAAHGFDQLVEERAGAPQRAQVARWVAPSSTSAELIAEGPHIAPNPKPAGEPANFSWSKHWYAVCAAHDVDPTRPLLLTLLGKNLVIWKDSSTGRWSCLEDRCPHRAAPLSEGKIWPDGSLCCSYHGWRFDCQGLCKAIQADSTEQEAKAAAAPRACAVAYPVQERQGMLFVWGEGGQAAFEEARRWEPPLCQLTLETEAEGREVMHVMRHYTRDLPYSYVALVENLVDPAHLPWAHHGVIGNRDQVAYGKSGMRRAGQLSAVHDHFDPFMKQTTITYHPPNLVTYAMDRKMGGKSALMFWVTPLAPLHTRVTMHFVYAANSPLPYERQMMSRPVWLDHIHQRSDVFVGDNVFLVGQDRNLAQHAQQEGATWRELFYMPTAADSLVAAVHAWIDKVAGGGPFGSLGDSNSPAARAAEAALRTGPGSQSRRDLLDRYSQHTVYCASCRSALQAVTTLRDFLAMAAVLVWAASLSPLFVVVSALLVPGAATGTPAAPQPAIGLALTAVLLAAALTAGVVILRRSRNMFLFVDYDHAHK